MVTDKEKQAFSNRLNAILDKAGIPPKGKGRQGALAKIFNVSDKGARKWIEGESIPTMAKIATIVERFRYTGVTAEWLLTGNESYAPNRNEDLETKEDTPLYTAQLFGGLSDEAIEFAKAWQELCPEQRAVLTATAKAFIHSAGKQKDKAV